MDRDNTAGLVEARAPRRRHLKEPILVGNRQIDLSNRIPGSSTGKPDRLMLLRNSIRPHINRKPSRKTLRTSRRNSNIKSRSTRTSITALARPAGQSRHRSRTTRTQRTRHRQIRGRRGGHRRLQLQSLRTAVLLHRRHRSRSIRRINQTQRHHRQRRRRRRLRNQPPPPQNPRRQHRRRQQQGQPSPAQHPAHRNPALQKPTHRDLPP